MNSVKCGFSQRVITPLNQGVFMDGYGFRLSPADGVLNELYVKVALFETEDDYFAIVNLDVCGIEHYLYNMVCDQIEFMTGLDRSKIALCATHTHSGPFANLLVGMPLSEDYWSYLGELCGRAILEAKENMCSCRFSSAIADTELTLSLNRRGRPVIDRRIRAAVFTDEKGEIRGVISSASCHPVINTSMKFSADYPSVLTREGTEKYGVPCLFLQGRGADINPAVDPEKSITENIEAVGGELVCGVFNAVEKSIGSTADAESIKSSYKYVTVPTMNPGSLEELESKLKERMDIYHSQEWSVQKHVDLRELEWYRRMINKVKQGEKPEINAPLQFFTINKELVFVIIPLEMLTLTGNKIEQMLVDKGYAPENIFVISYANDFYTYLPPIEEFAHGGYEVGNCAGAAAHWCGSYDFIEESENAVLGYVSEMLDELLN